MKTLRYVICDVFTDRPLSGNQLAVFTNSTGLDTTTMQALAREMGFSESVFVFRSETQAHAKLRIFTPNRELPFAGHPTLGAAFVLGQPLQVEQIRLETGAGIIPVTLEREGPRVVFGWMQQPLPKVTPVASPGPILAALGVEASALPVLHYDLGPSHIFVGLASPEAVGRVRPDMAALAACADAGVNVFARSGARWKNRVFAPSHGVNEDAATGSAAGPLAIHLCHHGLHAYGQVLEIEQGVEIERPARLFARVTGGEDGIQGVEVGGSAVTVASGDFRF